MSYPIPYFENTLINTNATTATTAINFAQTPAAVVATYVPMMPIVVQKVFVNLKTTLFNITSPVVTANIVTGVTNATPVTTAICTLTLPLSTTAAGSSAGTTFVNESFTPTLVPVGSQLSFSVGPGVAGGTAAGTGFVGFYATYSPEKNANETPNKVTVLTS